MSDDLDSLCRALIVVNAAGKNTDSVSDRQPDAKAYIGVRGAVINQYFVPGIQHFLITSPAPEGGSVKR